MNSHFPYAIGRLVRVEMDRQRLSRVDLVQRFGFRNIAKGLRRLDRLLETGFEPSLISKLAAALHVDQQAVDAAILETEAEVARERDDARQRDDDRERQNFRPYLLVQTEGFSRAGLFAAVQYERLKRIPVPTNILDKLLADQIVWVSRTVFEHYVTACGTVDGYGQITGYVFRRTPEDTILFEPTEGRVTNYFAAPPMEVRPRSGMMRRRSIARTDQSDFRPTPSPLLSVADDNLRTS